MARALADKSVRATLLLYFPMRIKVLKMRLRMSSVVVTPSVCKVTVLEICGGRVRLGFDVDSHVPVHRLELWAKLRAQESVALAAIAGPLTAGTEALPTG